MVVSQAVLAITLVLSLCWPVSSTAEAAQESRTLRIAAASHIKPAMDRLTEQFQARHPAVDVTLSYGSSGKLSAQIANGAPFDLFFSADMTYPDYLSQQGLAASEVRPYAVGRLVLWHRGTETPQLDQFAVDGSQRLAIANPRHAPYGQRAREFLESQGLWEPLQPSLVFGENVSQAAQFVHSGAADLGILALALALNPALQSTGSYTPIDPGLHKPLNQGYVVTLEGANNPAVTEFVRFLDSAGADATLRQFGFSVPQR